MIDQPPPPVGGQPPPPVPFGNPGFSGPVPTLPAGAYTPWHTRVFAWLLDYLPFSLIIGIGWAVLAATRETACLTDISEYDLGQFCATETSTIGLVSAWAVFPAFAVGYLVWNLGYRQGTTGSSVGKAILRFRLIGERSGAPIGFGLSVVRELIYLVLNVACLLLWLIAVLFPLWDAKRQSLVDKFLSTVCVPLPHY
ncbi:MAG: RDD family protein [Actinomycetota bacterium]|nr:RDD family protein [Actinomycetota bacterium]